MQKHPTLCSEEQAQGKQIHHWTTVTRPHINKNRERKNVTTYAFRIFTTERGTWRLRKVPRTDVVLHCPAYNYTVLTVIISPSASENVSMKSYLGTSICFFYIIPGEGLDWLCLDASTSLFMKRT